MRRTLFAVAIFILLAAQAAQAAPDFVQLHVQNPPEDGHLLHCAIFTSDAWQTNPREAQFVSWFSQHPQLRELRPPFAHFHHYKPSSRMYQAKFSGLVPPAAMPAMMLVEAGGGALYVARSNNLPNDPNELVRQIRYYSSLQPLPQRKQSEQVRIDSADVCGRVPYNPYQPNPYGPNPYQPGPYQPSPWDSRYPTGPVGPYPSPNIPQYPGGGGPSWLQDSADMFPPSGFPSLNSGSMSPVAWIGIALGALALLGVAFFVIRQLTDDDNDE